MQEEENNLPSAIDLPVENKKTFGQLKLLILLGTIILVLLGLIIGYFLYTDKNEELRSLSSLITLESNDQVVTASITPFPFQELTIPYLRAREYKSNLGELRQISENQNYTSYLTDYLSDGFKVNGLLTEPKGEMPEGGWPAIIFIHGYIPPNQYQTTQNYIAYTDYLSRNGFVLFKIDLRGNGNSEGEAGGAYYSSDYVIDTLNAYSALQNSSFVNKDKIGLWGHSMAGNIVSRSMAIKPEIKAVVIWAGAGYSYLDLAEFGIQDASYRPQPTDSERQRKRQQLRELYGDPKDRNPFWNLVASTNYLNDLKGAIQLHHAVDDNVVNIEYSRNLNNLLDQTEVIHELNEYPSGGHNISGASFNQAMQKTVGFFKKYL